MAGKIRILPAALRFSAAVLQFFIFFCEDKNFWSFSSDEKKKHSKLKLKLMNKK